MDKRFQSVIGQEYDLFLEAVPHFHELQRKISELTKDYALSSDLAQIEVLEIGCGTGVTSELICDTDPRIHLTTVDNEAVMIEQAQEKLKNYVRCNQIDFKEKDALDFLKTLEALSIDIFASAFTLHNFDQDYREAILREIYRVLKVGGLFINGDKYALDDPQEHRRSYEWQLRQFEEAFSKLKRTDLIKEWIEHYKKDDQDNLIMKERPSIELMQKIGFRDGEVCYRKKMEAVVRAFK